MLLHLGENALVASLLLGGQQCPFALACPCSPTPPRGDTRGELSLSFGYVALVCHVAFSVWRNVILIQRTLVVASDSGRR